MISHLSKFFVNRMLSKGIIVKSDIELYEYGAFILLSQTIYLIVSIACGVFFHCLFDSILFYFTFQLIRQFSGGYHATSEIKCEIFSSLSIIGCIGIIKVSSIYNMRTLIAIVAAISIVLIFILCPLDTPEKPLSEKEHKYFRKISIIILISIATVCIISFYLNYEFIFLPCCMSLILESVLLLIGKIKSIQNAKRQDRLL